jgi:DNA gyrase subunit A
MEDVIANEGCIITLSHKGFIKRTSESFYRSQKRGGKGVIGTDTYEEDFIKDIFTASTHDYIMFFMNNGRVYVEKAYEIPEGSRVSKGRAVANVLAMQKDEKIAAMICVKEFSDTQNLVMSTRKGIVKKTNLNAYSNLRKGGIIGIKINEGDDLIGVRLTSGEDEIVLVSHFGMAIRFKETDVRPMGRPSMGVIGMKFKREGDFIEAIEIVDPNSTLLIASEEGIGKRSEFEDYRATRRGGVGIIAIKAKSVAGALSVQEDDEIMLLTNKGQSVRCPVKDIRTIGRVSQGVRLINLKGRDKLVGIAKIIEVDEEEA